MDASQNLKKNCDVNQHTEKMASVKWFNMFVTPKNLFGISVVLIVFALASPVIFTKTPPLITFTENSGSIGSTFGIMNPFIAIAAAIITFAAFWVQYKANQEMLNDNKKQQIISRFYEMLRIHRDNVKELEWIEKIHYTKETNLKKMPKDAYGVENVKNQELSIESADEFVTKNGRLIFSYYIKEFDITYRIVNIIYPKLDIERKIAMAYSIFYVGADDERFDYKIRFAIRDALNKKLNVFQFENEIRDIVKSIDITEEQKNALVFVSDSLFYNRDYFSLSSPFMGHFEEINNYYRHLFLTVKTITQEEERYLSYDEKRDLLRILRAQLTETEQVMLFYNWLSGFGSKWETYNVEGNHFFTQYRMIHNLSPSRLVPFYEENDGYEEMIEKFSNHFRDAFLTEMYCKKSDPMFAFEEVLGFRFKYRS
jgi:hypothetical protein